MHVYTRISMGMKWPCTTFDLAYHLHHFGYRLPKGIQYGPTMRKPTTCYNLSKRGTRAQVVVVIKQNWTLTNCFSCWESETTNL